MCFLNAASGTRGKKKPKVPFNEILCCLPLVDEFQVLVIVCFLYINAYLIEEAISLCYRWKKMKSKSYQVPPRFIASLHQLN